MPQKKTDWVGMATVTGVALWFCFLIFSSVAIAVVVIHIIDKFW